MKIINYYCPEFEKGVELYQNLNILKENYPDIFLPNVNIKTIFGSFPNMIWNGGGTNLGSFISMDYVEEIKNIYKNLNISLQLTCTNPLLTQNDCYDQYCNQILKYFEDTNNSILVSSPILENYIKKNYPSYKIDRSIVNTSEDYNWEESLDVKYNNIVIPRRYNKNLDFLNTINKKYRNRIEILCNDPCPINCSRLYTHYEDYAKATLLECSVLNENIYCSNQYASKFLGYYHNEGYITYNDILNNYLPLNYTEFKISGRGNPETIITAIAPYLIKSKYISNTIKYLLES